MLRTFILLIILTSTISLAETPNLACLSGETVNEIFESRLSRSGRGFIVIVGEGIHKNGFTAEDWKNSIWNDQEFAQYLRDKKISVAFMDAHSDPAYYSTLNISSVPSVFFIEQKEVRSSRHGLGRATDESRQNMIDWIEAIRSGNTLVDSAYIAVNQDPENIELRQKLMKELWDERRQSEYTAQTCWLLEHNELNREYLAEQYVQEYDTVISEEEYRAGLLWQVMSLRDNAGLYKQASSGSSHEKDGWATQLSVLKFAKENPWRKMNSSYTESIQIVELVLKLRRALESKRDNNTATDRDLFILKALTAEGDEARALAEEYQPYFK